MPLAVLKRTLSYQTTMPGGAIRIFRRGEVAEVPEGMYHDLLRTGYFADPHREVDIIHPRQLRGMAPGSVVTVFRDVGLGDVLMASIPLAELQRQFPSINLAYAVHSHFVALFRGSNFVRGGVKAIVGITGRHPYGIDLRGLVERDEDSRRVDRIDLFSHWLLGRPPRSYRFPVVVTDAWRERGRRHAGIDLVRPSLGIVMRSSQPIRDWPLAYQRELMRLALLDGWQVVLLDRGRHRIGQFGHRDRIRDIRGMMSVSELADVVSALDVVVSPDTGTLHLAEAVRTRSVGYFTTVPPQLRVSHYRYHRAVYPEGALPCLGCTYSPTCGKQPPMPCARLSTPTQVWEQVQYVKNHQPPWSPWSWKPERAAEELTIG